MTTHSLADDVSGATQDADVLTQLEMRLNVDVDSVTTPTSDMEESNLEFPGSGNGEGEESWVAGSRGIADLGELLHDLEHSSSSSSDSELED